MESISDQPRIVPKPTSFNKVVIPSCNLVPEISILLPSNTDASRIRPPEIEQKPSYGAWKMKNQYATRLSKQLTKENIRTYTEPTPEPISKVSLRKHVRFDSSNAQKVMLKEVNKNDNFTKTGVDIHLQGNKTFEEIYMANVPNRHLDLSIIKPAIIQNNSNMQISNQTTLKANEPIGGSPIGNNRGFNNCKVSRTKLNEDENFISPTYALCDEYNKSIRMKTNNEPTVTDLLKVIHQQNEQILLLQKQVTVLLQNSSNRKEIEMCNKQDERRVIAQECIGCTNIEQAYNQRETARTVSKLAIDVMTSFEVSFRSSPSNLLQNTYPKQPNVKSQSREVIEQQPILNNKKEIKTNTILHDIKKQIVKDLEEKQNDDFTLTLNEPVQVLERCPSPENSIHVDMKDYSSDSDNEESTSSSDIGWTIYNNVMGQVNNILKKVDDTKQFQTRSNTDILGDKMLKKVREATMRHLKKIGVNLPVIKEPILQRSDETAQNSEYSPTEISFAVKQLLMKYLPPDQLAKLTQTITPNQPKDRDYCNTKNLIKRRPDFSFATVEYMKKYNLLTTDSTPIQTSFTNNADIPKILDVTALKQQPKLL